MGEIGLGAPVSVDGRGVAGRLQAFDRIAPLRGKDLLDFGCGNGMYTVRLAERFDAVTGIDVQADLLDEAKRHATAKGKKIQFRLAEDKLPFPDSSFDVVTLIEVLEHVSDERICLSEIRRVLRPDGRLYVAVPNRMFPIETHGIQLRGRWMPGRRLPGLTWLPPLHRRIADARIYTPRSLAAVLGSAGFKTSKPQFIMPPLDNWAPGREWLLGLFRLFEHSPLRRFGVSILVVARPV